MTIQPQPSKVIFEVVKGEGFYYRIKRSEFYSGDEGNPPLVKLLKYKTVKLSYIRAAAARCAKGKREEGYFIRFDGEKSVWICELDLSKGA